MRPYIINLKCVYMWHTHNRMADIMQKVLVYKIPRQAIVPHISIVFLSYSFNTSCSFVKHNLMTE